MATVFICDGAYNVGEFGELTIGNDVLVNYFVRIWCANKIVIGNRIRISWESQLMDSSFHYLVDDKGKTARCSGEIIIGNCCWVGNRVNYNMVAAVGEATPSVKALNSNIC